MSKLTDAKIRNSKQGGKLYKLFDGGGLYLEIKPTGRKTWRYSFRIEKKSSIFTIGSYPIVTLKKARRKHLAAKELVEQGINPNQQKRKEKEANVKAQEAEKLITEHTFEKVAQKWMQKQKDRWSTNHTRAVKRSLELNVYPYIGDEPVDSITPPLILAVLEKLEKRDALVLAGKVLQRITAVLRFAVQSGLSKTNPATEMKGVLKTRKVRHQPALTHKELPEFLRKLTDSDLHSTTKLALKFTILTAGRTGEIRGAKWNEINIEDALWEIPASRMKMARPHIVPLSQQAISILKAIGTMWGQTGYIFPGIRQESKQLSENTLLYSMYRLGYHGKATVHGFRATFSTIANESGFEPDIIEKALAHEERNAVRKAYNRSEYIQQRRKLMQWWADSLDQLEHGAETKNLN